MRLFDFQASQTVATSVKLSMTYHTALSHGVKYLRKTRLLAHQVLNIARPTPAISRTTLIISIGNHFERASLPPIALA